jgi:cell division protein ZapA
MSNNRIEAKIFDKEYIITGEEDPEYILSITKYVDQKMNELAKVFPNTSTLKLSILASVNIADELFQIKKNLTSQPKNTPKVNSELIDIYDQKTKNLISLLDKGLSGEL